LKNRILHIALSFCLLSNILFSQIILGFFHQHEDQVHISEITKKIQGNESVLTSHITHCKICSLEIIHELFYSEQIALDFSDNIPVEFRILNSGINSGITIFPQGRAPPFSLFI
jgi:hypothetical protein